MGPYRKRLSSQTRTTKFSACAVTVNQSIGMGYFPAAAAMKWFQNGLAKTRIIETTKQ
jgi:hypothetical protein